MKKAPAPGFSDVSAHLFPDFSPVTKAPLAQPDDKTGHRKRLRDRFLSDNGQAMPDYELLELFLMQVIPRKDVKPIAKRLLAEFGDLFSVVSAPLSRLCAVEGVGESTAVHLKTVAAIVVRSARARTRDRNVISSWAAVVSYCRLEMANRDTENFRVLFLDRKNRLIGDEVLGAGTVDHVPVYTREVVKRALELAATAIILVHNHPSGDPTPSQADIDMTKVIDQACQTVSITVHDHIIIGLEGETSLRSEGHFDA